MFFPFIIGGKRGSFNANYSVNLPRGLLTNVLCEFCKSRWTVLKNTEMAGQSGIPIHQDDLDKCMGVMTALVNQKVNDAKAQQEMLEERIHRLKSELSRPISFTDEGESELSFIDEFIQFKEKIVSLKERRPA